VKGEDLKSLRMKIFVERHNKRKKGTCSCW